MYNHSQPTPKPGCNAEKSLSSPLLGKLWGYSHVCVQSHHNNDNDEEEDDGGGILVVASK